MAQYNRGHGHGAGDFGPLSCLWRSRLPWDRRAEIGRDHLRNPRLSRHGHDAGPELAGNPRGFVDVQGRTTTVLPHEGGYHDNVTALGGGTRVYGAQAWRFMPQDSRMASLYGVPERWAFRFRVVGRPAGLRLGRRGGGIPSRRGFLHLPMPLLSRGVSQNGR